MQHERNYDDEQLARLSHMRRLDIDPNRIEMGWVIDFCAQSLRNIVIGLGGRMDGFLMQSEFAIAVSSELMAILSIVNDLADLRKRIGEITVLMIRRGKPVTTNDLEVAGAMAALMRNTINPTLCCTAEYQPCMVHAGPFANIAVGQSSIIADRLGLKMFDYHVTESGFAADIGFEKFWNVKCRYQRLETQCFSADCQRPRPEDARRRTQSYPRSGLPDAYKRKPVRSSKKAVRICCIIFIPSGPPVSIR